MTNAKPSVIKVTVFTKSLQNAETGDLPKMINGKKKKKNRNLFTENYIYISINYISITTYILKITLCRAYAIEVPD